MAKLRGRPKTTSDETIARIYELYDTGDYGYKLIAKTLGISREVVRYWLRYRQKHLNNDV